jgi:histidinol phosphatase-like enzyme
MNSLKLVIVDRDGTINQDSAEFIKSADEWHALPGSLEAIARLNPCGLACGGGVQSVRAGPRTVRGV